MALRCMVWAAADEDADDDDAAVDAAAAAIDLNTIGWLAHTRLSRSAGSSRPGSFVMLLLRRFVTRLKFVGGYLYFGGNEQRHNCIIVSFIMGAEYSYETRGG